MKAGFYAGEEWHEIIARKQGKIYSTGVTFRGYGGSAWHPLRQVQPFCPRVRRRCRRHHALEGEPSPQSVPRRQDRLEPLETGGWPQGFRVVVDLERMRRVREHDPGQFGPGEDGTSGTTLEGWSSVPPRTNRIPGW